MFGRLTETPEEDIGSPKKEEPARLADYKSSGPGNLTFYVLYLVSICDPSALGCHLGLARSDSRAAPDRAALGPGDQRR